VIVNHAVTKKVMDQDEAKAAGALAFFGDKYEDKVRVVAVPGVSQELCGGTHLDSTGQIGLFKIISESSVASGVRRIEGVTGKAAYELIRQQQGILNEVAETLRVPREKLASEVQKKLARIKELEKQLSSAKSGSVISVIDEAVRQAEEIAGIKVVARMLEAADMAQIRSAMDAAKQKLGSGAVALAGVSEGKVALGIGFTPDLVAKGFDAGAAVREVAPLIGGSGGGRKDFAQAGGSDESGINKAFEKFKNWLRK
jgi:alanyl-tRNA synthetase